MSKTIIESQYNKLITIAGTASSCVAIFLILIKTFAWLYSDSSAIFASLIDSALDFFASGINLFAIRYSIIPRDEDHKYGHGKAEALAGLLQSAFIFGSSIFLIMHGISKVINTVELEHIKLSIIVTMIAIIVTILLVLFQSYVVRKTHSTAVHADLIHYKSDILLNISVIVSLIFVNYGMLYMDGVFAILIGFYISISAFHITRKSTNILLDHQLNKDDEDKIKELTLSVPGIIAIGDFRTRNSGPTFFVQMIVYLDDNITLLDAHLLTEQVESKISSEYSTCDIIIHMEPISKSCKNNN